MKHNLLWVALLCATALSAAPTTGYYSTLEGKSGTNLKSALTGIISNHTNVGYDGLYEVYAKADVRADGTLWDMYSDCTFDVNNHKGSNAEVCGCYNREHSLPKSWWGGNKAAQYSDAYHVVPTDCRVNNQRANYAFGECANGTRLSVKARGKLGTSTFPGYSGTVFEPDDEYKGDFARHYLYMLIAYPNVDFSSGNGGAMFEYAGELTDYGLALLLKWHRLDPVSQKELDRNDAVNSFQHNRNPFIDYPCLVEYIWGDQRNETLHLQDIMSAYATEYFSSEQDGCHTQPTSPTILTPQKNSTIEIGSASINQTVTKYVNVSGTLLNAPLELSLSGTDADLFSLSTTSIPAATANVGTDIAISYRPTRLGKHNAQLTLSSKGANSQSVTLAGSCIASLTNPTTDVYITNNNVGTAMPFTIYVAGTNLKSDLSLAISGTYAAMYKLNQTTISAADAQKGININGTYTPTTVGTHNVTLTITSPDFSTRTISIKGNCLFTVLPVTNITYHSAQLNWTNAGTTSYTINVYQKSIGGTEEELILTDNCAQTKGQTGGGYTAVEKESLRIASGAKDGSLTFANLNLADGGHIDFEAMYYGNDKSSIHILVADKEIATKELTNEFKTYSIELEPNEANRNTSVTFYAEKGKRLYLKTVNIYVGGEKIENNSLAGYPLTVSNMQSHIVEGLDSLTEYWFTVQPQGQAVSEETMFITDNTSTSVNSSAIYEGATYSLTANGIELTRLPLGATLQVYDALGRLIVNRLTATNSEHIALPQGFYLIKINQQTIRIVR